MVCKTSEFDYWSKVFYLKYKPISKTATTEQLSHLSSETTEAWLDCTFPLPIVDIIREFIEPCNGPASLPPHHTHLIIAYLN